MTAKVKIGERWVGEGEPTLIIAEVGCNHDGDLIQAKKLIDVAASSGVDAVKFQIFRAESLYTRDNPAYEIILANELPREWVAGLAEHAQHQGIMFSASPFDREAVDLLCDVGVPFLKWASPEIHDLPLLKYAANKGRPLVVSTGMCDVVDIHHAVEAARSQGNNDIVLLHCVSSYPTEAGHANIRMMDSISHTFQLPVGFSDHTRSIAIPVAAVARGACVIEKHFTLSRQLQGPDHSFALEPDELELMVRSIREAEESLGSSVKEPIHGAENIPLNNKSMVADVDILQGTTLTADMLTVKRARHGIKPVLMDVVVGRRAARDIKRDEVITWDAI